MLIKLSDNCPTFVAASGLDPGITTKTGLNNKRNTSKLLHSRLIYGRKIADGARKSPLCRLAFLASYFSK